MKNLLLLLFVVISFSSCKKGGVPLGDFDIQPAPEFKFIASSGVIENREATLTIVFDVSSGWGDTSIESNDIIADKIQKDNSALRVVVVSGSDSHTGGLIVIKEGHKVRITVKGYMTLGENFNGLKISKIGWSINGEKKVFQTSGFENFKTAVF